MPSKAKAKTVKSPVVEIHSSAKPGFIPIIGMLVFAVVVVTSGGVLFAAYQQSKKPVETIPVVLKTDAGSSQNANVNLNTNASPDTDTVQTGWKSYTNSDLGISFAYPAEFGDVTISVTTPETNPAQLGKKITGSFSNFSGLTFGGITADYEYGGEGSVTDTRGFLEQDGKYYFKFVSVQPDTGYPLEPLAVLLTEDGQKALLLEKYSFVNERGSDGPTIGGTLGDFNLSALVNIADDEFTGLMFVNTDTKNFSREKFEQFVETLSIGVSEISREPVALGSGFASVVSQGATANDWLIHMDNSRLVYWDGTSVKTIVEVSGVADIAFNGSIWLISSPGFLATFDGAVYTKVFEDSSKYFENIAWEDTRWLVSEGGPRYQVSANTMYYFDGKELEAASQLTEYLQANQIDPLVMKWNGEHWLIASQNRAATLIKYSPVSGVSQNLTSQLDGLDGWVTAVEYLGGQWLIGGGKEISQQQGTAGSQVKPSLYSYDGSNIINLTEKISSIFQQNPVERIISSHGVWLIASRYNLAKLSEEDVTDYTRKIDSFRHSNYDSIIGVGGLENLFQVILYVGGGIQAVPIGQD